MSRGTVALLAGLVLVAVVPGVVVVAVVLREPALSWPVRLTGVIGGVLPMLIVVAVLGTILRASRGALVTVEVADRVPG